MSDTQPKLAAYWSVDENHIYLYDNIDQYNVVEVTFTDIKLNKQEKLSVLGALVSNLTMELKK